MTLSSKLKNYTLTIATALVLVFGVAAPLTAPATVAADSKSQICAGIGVAGGNCQNGAGGSSLEHVLKFVIQLLSWIVGIAAIIMIIISAIKFTTAGGDASAVSSAKSTLLFAIIGLIVAALAQVIVHFVLGNV